MKSANLRFCDYFYPSNNDDARNKSNFSELFEKTFAEWVNKFSENIQRNVKQFEFLIDIQGSNREQRQESEIVHELVFQRFSDALKKFNIKNNYLGPKYFDKIQNPHTILLKTNEETEIYEKMLKTNEETEKGRVSKLITELAIQEKMMKQICKAQHFCYKSKKFCGSSEHIEAERALLILVAKSTILFLKLYEMQYGTMEKPFLNTATVKILSVTFHPNVCNVARNFDQWFIYTLKRKETFYASHIVIVDKQGRASFKEEFQFENLTTDFEIELNLFALKIDNNKHKPKFRLIKNSNIKMPTKNKIKDTLTCKYPNFFASAFRLYGQTTITLENFQNELFELYDVPSSSNLNFVEIKMKKFFTFKEHKEGFLALGFKDDKQIYWNRRWCSLKGSFFAYWNSPGEADEEEPLEVFDLRSCPTQRVSKVERSICSRPRTLKLDVINKQESATGKIEHRIRSLFLAADTLTDMREWEKSFANVMGTLKEWELK